MHVAFALLMLAPAKCGPGSVGESQWTLDLQAFESSIGESAQATKTASAAIDSAENIFFDTMARMYRNHPCGCPVRVPLQLVAPQTDNLRTRGLFSALVAHSSGRSHQHYVVRFAQLLGIYIRALTAHLDRSLRRIGKTWTHTIAGEFEVLVERHRARLAEAQREVAREIGLHQRELGWAIERCDCSDQPVRCVRRQAKYAKASSRKMRQTRTRGDQL